MTPYVIARRKAELPLRRVQSLLTVIVAAVVDVMEQRLGVAVFGLACLFSSVASSCVVAKRVTLRGRARRIVAISHENVFVTKGRPATPGISTILPTAACGAYPASVAWSWVALLSFPPMPEVVLFRLIDTDALRRFCCRGNGLVLVPGGPSLLKNSLVTPCCLYDLYDNPCFTGLDNPKPLRLFEI